MPTAPLPLRHQLLPTTLPLNALWLPIASAFLSYIAWGHTLSLLATLPLLALLWQVSPSRLVCWLTFCSYYLVGCRGLLVGASVFFSDPNAQPQWWAGLAACALPSFVLAAVWAIAWGQNYRAIRFASVLLVMMVPPVGIIGWLSPIVASGALFPGFAWTGLGLTVVLMLCLASQPFRRLIWILPSLLLSSALANASYTAPNRLDFVAINTQLPGAENAGFARLQYLRELVREASGKNDPGSILVMPEAVAGDWLQAAAWWEKTSDELNAKGQTLVIGANRVVDVGTNQRNMLVTIGRYAGIEMPDRMPVPISMWRPWSDGSFEANFENQGAARIGHLTVAHLICYEQLLGWSALESMAQKPDILIGASNSWWATGTNIPDVQRMHVQVWARLFSVQYIYSQNIQ